MGAKWFLGTFLICCFARGAAGQAAQDAVKCKGHDDKPADCNGISVGAPKVFDNRSLTLMLEELNQTLQAQQKNYIDQKILLGALTNLQGLSTQETSTNLSITASPTPGSDVTTDLKTGNVDASGNRLPNIFERKTDTNTPSVTPQAPGFDTLPGLPSGFNPTFGSSASDLLNDQVNLTYQIFNLRMILERALSDRLRPDDTTECDKSTPANCNKTRLQAVLGFNVTIDPPRTANDAAAVVEIRLKAPAGASLVSLMPQEKTYNAAALSSKSNAFAGAAVVSAFQVGFSARKRGQIFYLYRDTDTLSYERMTDNGNLVFGWMFRPVLGRRSISPGLRQMFAILALPKVDCTSNESPEKNVCSEPISTSVRTYWKKYDRNTLTSFEKRDVNRARKYWYALSLEQARPQLFDNYKYENFATYERTVESSATYQQDLSPAVRAVEWQPTGTNSVVVSVHGNNFFSYTEVALGDKIYTKPENGLILKSAQGFDLKTNLDALANGPGVIVGRYGTSVPLVGNGPSPRDLAGNGIEIAGAEIRPSLSGIRKIEIHLQQKLSEQTQLELVEHQKAYQESLNADVANPMEVRQALDAVEQKAKLEHQLVEDKLPSVRLSDSVMVTETPILSVNGTALSLPYEIATDRLNHQVVIQANLPDSVLTHGGGLVKVTWPFYRPDRWTATTRLYDPALGFQVTRLSEKSILISRINGLSFARAPENLPNDNCWTLVAGDVAKILRTTRCTPPTKKEEVKPAEKGNPTKDSKDSPELQLAKALEYTVVATFDKLPSHVVLLAPSGTAYRLDVPDVTDKKEEKPKPLEMKQYDSTWIDIKLDAGKTPLKIEAAGNPLVKVEANGKPLTWRPDDSAGKPADPKGGPTIHVEVTRELTSKPGLIDITVVYLNKVIGTKQVSVVCAPCTEKGDK